MNDDVTEMLTETQWKEAQEGTTTLTAFRIESKGEKKKKRKNVCFMERRREEKERKTKNR